MEIDGELYPGCWYLYYRGQCKNMTCELLSPYFHSPPLPNKSWSIQKFAYLRKNSVGDGEYLQMYGYVCGFVEAVLIRDDLGIKLVSKGGPIPYAIINSPDNPVYVLEDVESAKRYVLDIPSSKAFLIDKITDPRLMEEWLCGRSKEEASEKSEDNEASFDEDAWVEPPMLNTRMGKNGMWSKRRRNVSHFNRKKHIR